MNGKKILFVSSELVPYLPENEVSLMSYETPKMVNSNGVRLGFLCQNMGISTKGGINYTKLFDCLG